MKKIFLITLMSLITVLMVAMAYAVGTCVVVTPGASAVIKGTYVFNVTTGVNETIVNCTSTATSALTSDTWKVVLLNHSALNSTNASISSTAEVDASDWSFTFSCVNQTSDELYSCSRTGVTIDNTVPVATLSTPTSGSKDTDGSISFTYTCSNATSADIYVEGTKYTMTESSDSCTYTLTIPTNGFHSHYIIGSDGLNTTTSATSTIEVRKPGGYIYDEQGQIMTDTAGAVVPTGGNIVTNTVDKLFSFIFGIFDSIFSIFK